MKEKLIYGCREKIKVPKSKPYIFLRGNGKGKTGIVWNDTSLVNIKSATFTVEATNFVAWGISFKVIKVTNLSLLLEGTP